MEATPREQYLENNITKINYYNRYISKEASLKKGARGGSFLEGADGRRPFFLSREFIYYHHYALRSSIRGLRARRAPPWLPNHLRPS